MFQNYTTSPQSSVGGQPAVIRPVNAAGNAQGSVGATPVVGVQEVRTITEARATNYTVPAGALAVDIRFASDFEGTIYGLDYTGADDTGWHDQAAPGNTLPAVAITRSAGTFDVIESRPA